MTISTNEMLRASKHAIIFVSYGLASWSGSAVAQTSGDTNDMPGMKMDDSQHMMSGGLGGYSMMRDSSGTSWQPDTTPMEGIEGSLDDWLTMAHGYANLIYDNQGGPRGGTKTFSNSMLMGMAQHALGRGQLTLHGMISLDPLMGKSGYPLLLQTGETANGTTR